MPYSSINELPESFKNYGRNQKRAAMKAFNSCHADGGDEEKCFKVAHSAAKGAGNSRKTIKASKK